MIDQLQVHDASETCDPATRLRIRSCDDVTTSNEQCFGVMCGRCRRIWERLLPRLQICFEAKLDIGEKVLSGARDP